MSVNKYIGRVETTLTALENPARKKKLWRNMRNIGNSKCNVQIFSIA